MISRYLLLDLETITAADAKQWMPRIDPDGRLTDPVKIAADLEKKEAALLGRGGLNPNMNRIVCFGAWLHNGNLDVTIAPTEDVERELLKHLWAYTAESVPFVGYGLSWFDAGTLVRRSQKLNVTIPERFYEQAKYRRPLIIDLADRISLNGLIEFERDEKKGCGLDYYCRMFGIDVPDDHSGKDISALWEAKDYDGVKGHCAADMLRIKQLAQRLGVIPTPQPSTAHEPLTFKNAF